MCAYCEDQQLPIGSTHPNLGNNKSADGIITFGLMGDDVEFGQLVYQQTNNKWYKTVGTDTYPAAKGITAWKTTKDKLCPIMKQGYIRNDAWNFNLGRDLYTNYESAGNITATASTEYRHVIGQAERPNVLYFNPDSNVNYGTRVTYSNLQRDIDSLYQNQSNLYVIPIWAAGQYTLLDGNKHGRLKIVDAWVEVKDNSDLDSTVEIIGLSNPLYVPNTYSAGVSIPIDVLRKNIGLNEFVYVRASTNKRLSVHLQCESDE